MDQKIPETDAERFNMLRTIVRAGQCDFAYSCFLLRTETLDEVKDQLKKVAHLQRVIQIADSRNRNAQGSLVRSVAHLEMCLRRFYALLPSHLAPRYSFPHVEPTHTGRRYEEWVEFAERLLQNGRIDFDAGSSGSVRRGALEQAVAVARRAHANGAVTAETAQMILATSISLRHEVDALLQAVYRELCASLCHRTVAEQRAILHGYGVLNLHSVSQYPQVPNIPFDMRQHA